MAESLGATRGFALKTAQRALERASGVGDAQGAMGGGPRYQSGVVAVLHYPRFGVVGHCS